MSKKGLTAKQAAFVEEYLVDLNATQAAIRAGYSKKTAEAIGHENLRKPKIAKIIQLRMKDRENRTEITQDRVLEELALIGFARIDDFLRVEEREVVVGYEKDAEGNPDQTKPKLRKQKVLEIFETSKVPKDKLAAVSEIKHTRHGLGIKLHDKIKALEDLGRHLGMWNDKLEITGEMEIEVTLEDDED